VQTERGMEEEDEGLPFNRRKSSLRYSSANRCESYVSERVLLFFNVSRYLILEGDVLYAYENINASNLIWKISLSHCGISRGTSNCDIVLTPKTEKQHILQIPSELFARWWNALHSSSSVRLENYYELGPILGEGAYSQVRYGRDKISKQVVAVKIMHKKSKSVKQQKLNECLYVLQQREVELMRSFEHENIVKVIDVFEGMKRVYIVMEFVAGGSLFEFLTNRQNQHLEQHVVHIIRQILSAVHYLHEKGVVHRDLKLENIMCTSKAWPTDVKVADFGLAGLLTDDEDSVMTSLVGTPYYMAPELLRGDKYDESVDMWALGVIVFSLLTGAFPFKGKNPAQILKSIESCDSVRLPESVLSSISAESESLVRSLLQKDPKKRLSASAALNHPWLTQDPSKLQRSISRDLKPDLLQIASLLSGYETNGSFGEFSPQTKFKATVQSLIAIHRMRDLVVLERKRKLRRLFFSAMAANKLVTIQKHQ